MAEAVLTFAFSRDFAIPTKEAGLEKKIENKEFSDFLLDKISLKSKKSLSYHGLIICKSAHAGMQQSLYQTLKRESGNRSEIKGDVYYDVGKISAFYKNWDKLNDSQRDAFNYRYKTKSIKEGKCLNNLNIRTDSKVLSLKADAVGILRHSRGIGDFRYIILDHGKNRSLLGKRMQRFEYLGIAKHSSSGQYEWMRN